jgi:choice-of-anchor C domain-containing protein
VDQLRSTNEAGAAARLAVVDIEAAWGGYAGHTVDCSDGDRPEPWTNAIRMSVKEFATPGSLLTKLRNALVAGSASFHPTKRGQEEMAKAFLTTLPSGVLRNGDFEAPVVSGEFQTIGQGEDLDGWRVTSGSVDLVHDSYWSAYSGKQSLDLDGCSAGRIAQSFSTLPGQSYVVSLAFAGNPDMGGEKSFHAEIDGASEAVFAFDSSLTTRRDMGWATGEFSFVASGVVTELAFSSDTPGCHGAAIDQVTVTATTYATE